MLKQKVVTAKQYGVIKSICFLYSIENSCKLLVNVTLVHGYDTILYLMYGWDIEINNNATLQQNDVFTMVNHMFLHIFAQFNFV